MTTKRTEGDRVPSFFERMYEGRKTVVAINVISMLVGGFIGFLIGEGRAREAFSAQYQDHERRMVILEQDNRDARVMFREILVKLSTLEGATTTLSTHLLGSKQKDDN